MMLDFELTVAKGRPTIGAPLTRAIRTAAEVDGFGLETGLSDVQKAALNFQNPQMREIRIAGREER